MPINKCKLSKSSSGFKYGNAGKCYQKRDDALKQMRAVHASRSRRK